MWSVIPASHFNLTEASEPPCERTRTQVNPQCLLSFCVTQSMSTCPGTQRSSSADSPRPYRVILVPPFRLPSLGEMLVTTAKRVDQTFDLMTVASVRWSTGLYHFPRMFLEILLVFQTSRSHFFPSLGRRLSLSFSMWCVIFVFQKHQGFSVTM